MNDLKLGITLWNQASDWATFLDAARRVDALGYDHVWTWDHLHAIVGDPYQPTFEGYTAMAAVAQATERVRLGLFVGANTFRNPGLAVKSITTIDHISGGRAIFGLGAAWFELEHREFGIDFGRSPGERLTWLEESVAAARALFDGEEVTSPPGGRYALDHLRIYPPPVQPHLPIMIGGGGERKTLRIVAGYADLWNVGGSLEVVAHKDEVLRGHCGEIGRDESTIERTLGCKPTIRATEAEARSAYREQRDLNRRSPGDEDVEAEWIGTPDQIAERMVAFRRIGFHTFVAELPYPYDAETMETWMKVVKPMVEGASTPA
jgi:alkanesulfonate monooxygenase SsuD/methylene tetrahydromethanopterin reductase-like flavin-dependent oxidoreductase (luciferase family)